MAGKVLAVATLAAITGLLNLASMSLTVLEGARIADGRTRLHASLAARRRRSCWWSRPPRSCSRR